jgi:hypothetical protein
MQKQIHQNPTKKNNFKDASSYSFSHVSSETSQGYVSATTANRQISRRLWISRNMGLGIQDPAYLDPQARKS